MNDEATARKIFEAAIAKAATDGDIAKADKRRLLCEFFCNPEFRKAMQDEVARLNGL
jgi:hypothetical protein